MTQQEKITRIRQIIAEARIVRGVGNTDFPSALHPEQDEHPFPYLRRHLLLDIQYTARAYRVEDALRQMVEERHATSLHSLGIEQLEQIRAALDQCIPAPAMPGNVEGRAG